MALRPLIMVVSVALGIGCAASAWAQSSTPPSLTFATPDGLFQQRLDQPRQALLDLRPGSAVDPTVPSDSTDSTELGRIESMTWSPQGNALAVVDSEGRVLWVDPNTGEMAPIFTSQCPRPPTLDVAWQAQPLALVIQEQCEGPNGSTAWAAFWANTTAPPQPLPLPQNATALAVAPDGRQIAYVADQHIYVKKAAQTEAAWPSSPRQLTQTPGIYAAAGSALVWSPDGQKLAFHEGSYPFQRIHVLEVDTGEHRILTPEADFQIYRSHLLWSPDGRYLAFYQPANPPLSNQEVVAVLEVATGERQGLTRPGFYNALSWSPDGQTLAFSSGNRWEQQTLFTVSLATQTFTALTPQSFQTVQQSEWSPQGDWIAFTAIALGDDLGTQRLYVVRPDGSQLTPLTQANEYAFPVAWNPR